MNSATNHNSFVHDLQIASPCRADWNKMSGDERKRFCGDCKLHVYNIKEMTLPEAEQLIIDAQGKVCLRLYRRADGTVMTKDCPVGLRERLKRRWVAASAALAAAASVVVAFVLKTTPPQAVSYQVGEAEQGGVTADPDYVRNKNMQIRMGEVAPMTGSVAPMHTMGIPVSPQPANTTGDSAGKPVQLNAIMGKVAPAATTNASEVMGRVKR